MNEKTEQANCLACGQVRTAELCFDSSQNKRAGARHVFVYINRSPPVGQTEANDGEL